MYEGAELTDQILLYTTHNADHSGITEGARLAVQHYRESLVRLNRKRLAYVGAIQAIPVRPMGLSRAPAATQQDILFELVQSFFDQVYSTLSALGSVLSRLGALPGRSAPPTKSNEKFIKWWETALQGTDGRRAVAVLMAARDFRTLSAHPQQFPIFDWSTVERSRDEIAVVLHGPESSQGNAPQGATRLAHDPSRWAFLAPDMSEVLEVFLTLNTYTFGPMIDLYPPTDDEVYCTWEADGTGSGPGLDIVVALYELVRTADTATRSQLTPDIDVEFEQYIASLTEIRVLGERRRDAIIDATRRIVRQLPH